MSEIVPMPGSVVRAPVSSALPCFSVSLGFAVSGALARSMLTA
jgi:hypothetical protein